MTKDPLERVLMDVALHPGVGVTRVVEDVAAAGPDPGVVARLAGFLGDDDPRLRGAAAETLALLAERAPEAVRPHVAALVESLHCDEIHTRQESYRALAAVALVDPLALEEEFDLVRLGAFDPANPAIRRHSALAVARFGAGDPERGRRAFPHLAEALRRFHDRERPGDLVEALAILARRDPDPWLRAEIWKSARKLERHPDAAVRQIVDEIGALVR